MVPPGPARPTSWEAGVSFVTIDLSNHSASGTWDTHGDNIPAPTEASGTDSPLLPVFDHLITTLVSDLATVTFDDVLVLAMASSDAPRASGPRAAPTDATIGPW